MNFYRNVYATLCCIGFLLLIIATASPFWMIHHCIDDYIHMGLWIVCSETMCYKVPSTASMKAAQALMIIALGISFIALVSSWDLLNRFVNRKVPEAFISSMANYVAGLCTLCTLMIMYLQLRIIQLMDTKHLAPDWAFSISCVACSIYFVIGTVNLILHGDLVLRERNPTPQVAPTEQIEHSP
ncbi:lens fiber membrane intrinsic protein-like [Hemicordylus capensis]|uniref:lens fiber membrane intrinsic protein-like n=1 Tax=Hemicordylus capensis TaxID=884348 RepID=UPI002302038C|nr:lens fiber membrane intrinsic protein-like [Hemicordylus capensis]